MMLNH